jgi:phage gpG-like protein
MTVAEISGYFTNMAGRVLNADFTPTLEHARDWIAKDTANCFATSTSPKGQAWAPIHHRIGKPLVHTGLMYLSVVDQISEGDIAANCLRIRIDHPFYAKFHQFGTQRIKQREWLGITELTEKRIYADAVVEIVRQLITGNAT